MGKILTMLVGPPGAGKSTYRKFRLPNAHMISPDEFLYEGSRYVWNPRRSAEAWRKSYLLYGMALREGIDSIVWDATFMTEISRSSILHIAKGFGYEVDAVVLSTPLNVCLARNAARSEDRKVPMEQVLKFFQAFQMPTTEEGFDRVVMA